VIGNSKLKFGKLFLLFTCVHLLAFSDFSMGQEIKEEGWPIPDLKGLIPYSITIRETDGVEKIIEKFYTPDGGIVGRISGNGKVYAYIIDSDENPPIDYLLLDTDGSGKFTKKYGSQDTYLIPEWVSHELHP
jgi:hypothetical protein